MDKITVTSEFFNDIIVFATRYCIGRHSIGAMMFAQYDLPNHWGHINANMRAVIKRDIEEHLRFSRANGYEDNCMEKRDNEIWEKILLLPNTESKKQ